MKDQVQSLRPIAGRHGWGYFGQRYLKVDRFVDLCQAVALYVCTEDELEAYERDRLLFPAARLVLPDEYACDLHWLEQGTVTNLEIDAQYEAVHKLNWAIKYPISLPLPGAPLDERHAIDRAWGAVQGLVRPSDEVYKPWANFAVSIELGGNEYAIPTATHYYHSWQIHEVYLVRRLHRNLYQDRLVFRWPPGSLSGQDDGVLWRFFDATSQFRQTSTIRRLNMVAGVAPDDDSWITA